MIEEYVDTNTLIERALRADAHQADRAIARECGCAHSHVARIRARLVADQVIDAVRPHPPKRGDPIVKFADPPAPTEPRWRPPGPFSRIDAAERERDELFLQVQALTAECDALRARLAEATA